MLIINADDWGRNATSTNNSLFCSRYNRITSVTAMMFMEDTSRSADLAIDLGIDVGLHLNFTDQFNAKNKHAKLLECHKRIASFLLSNKYSLILYNPLLKSDFEYVYKAQYDEYIRLYNKPPTHIDGHHHMHLCTNMLVAGLMSSNHKVRKSFTFNSEEKSTVNRFYRYLIDAWLKRKYVCTDYFFSIAPIHDSKRLENIVKLSMLYNVELMVHPELTDEYKYLMSDEYMHSISDTNIGSFSDL